MNCRASVGPISIPRATQFQRSLPRSGWRLFALGVFAAGSWGCGGKDEPVSTVPTGNATISATESSAIASPVGDDEPDSRVKSSSSASPGRMSLSDLDLADSAVGPKSDEASSSQRSVREKPPTTLPTSASSGSAPNIPQELADAPTKKFAVPFPDTKIPKQQFFAKVLSENRVMLHGPYREYRRDGTKYKQGMHDYGKKSGEWVFWNPEGTVVKQGEYVDDKPHGKWTVRRDDGTIDREELYDRGLKHGRWAAYQKDGSTLMWERDFQNGEKDGVWVDYYDDGRKKVEIHWKAGKQDGPTRSWYENGQLQNEAFYKDGKPDGALTRWSKSGAVTEQAKYKDGKRLYK